ncbi:WD domain, G-beta repeat-containing protein [Cardiosporidium cionae]|uniref:WD domain, G-beta repeat-containing protein n=1 Tax=Cardiosporidium cionae TaxID=476202 RepID=A0ABQ7J9X5_9APIC|nr:WD domain, G-beta repeat-containing protein [Cardiosporidium cionae]|eukprot:KAF8820771.1 WD domain, G-beta repeat-containing protein [Cardiosporidium cionae]
MLIEKLEHCHHGGDAIIALEFQPHSEPGELERLATAATCNIKIWAFYGEVVCIKRCNKSICQDMPLDSAEQKLLDIDRVVEFEDRCSRMRQKNHRSLTASMCLYTCDQHSPYEVCTLKWSLSGIFLASSDTCGFIHIHEQEKIKKSEEEVWKINATLRCPQTMGYLFDIAWSADDQYIVGGGIAGKIYIFDVATKETAMKINSPVMDAGFVKGIGWNCSSDYLAAQTSNRHIMIWKNYAKDEDALVHAIPWNFLPLFCSQELFKEGPGDIPSSRPISWDPSGSLVVFPFGEHKGSFFGVCFDISTADESILWTQPFRLRGHQARVKNVSFSGHILKESPTSRSSRVCLYPKHFVLYAQMSEDGCLSIWRIELSTQDSIEKKPLNERCVCLFVLTRLLDEQSCCVGLTWGDRGEYLAVGSSSGGILLIIFNEEDLGVQFEAGIPSPPPQPISIPQKQYMPPNSTNSVTVELSQ